MDCTGGKRKKNQAKYNAMFWALFDFDMSKRLESASPFIQNRQSSAPRSDIHTMAQVVSVHQINLSLFA
jgi:hypothetical protein